MTFFSTYHIYSINIYLYWQLLNKVLKVLIKIKKKSVTLYMMDVNKIYHDKSLPHILNTLFYQLSNIQYSNINHYHYHRWHSGKNHTCQCRRRKRLWFDPWIKKIPGGGHGNPLQYSCLENSMDRGAQRAKVHRVAQSQTRLKRLITYTHMCQRPCWRMQ